MIAFLTRNPAVAMFGAAILIGVGIFYAGVFINDARRDEEQAKQTVETIENVDEAQSCGDGLGWFERLQQCGN